MKCKELNEKYERNLLNYFAICKAVFSSKATFCVRCAYMLAVDLLR